MSWTVKVGVAVFVGSVALAAALGTAATALVALGALRFATRPEGAEWVLERTRPERLQVLATQLTKDPASHGLYVERGIEHCYPTAKGDLSALPPELQALRPTTVVVNGDGVLLDWRHDHTYPAGYALRLLAPGADESWLRSPGADGSVKRELHPRIWSCYQR